MVDRSGLFVAPLPGATPQGTSPTDGRLVLGALFGTSGGCLAGGTLTASGSLMQVSVAAATWRIPDPSNSAAVFLAPADAATLTFSAGPASGSRIDLLWVRQNNFEAGDANSRVVYGVTAGTAASSPVAPALPAGAMKIGQLTVPAGVNNAAACALVPIYPQRTVLKDGARYMRAKNTAAQSIPSGTWTTLGFAATASDPTGQMATGGANILLPWAGSYRVLVRASFNGGNQPSAVVGLREKLFDAIAGVGYTGLSQRIGYVTDGHFELNDVITASAGSTLQIEIFQNTGATQTFAGYTDDLYRQVVAVEWIGPA